MTRSCTTTGEDRQIVTQVGPQSSAVPPRECWYHIWFLAQIKHPGPLPVLWTLPSSSWMEGTLQSLCPSHFFFDTVFTQLNYSVCNLLPLASCEKMKCLEARIKGACQHDNRFWVKLIKRKTCPDITSCAPLELLQCRTIFSSWLQASWKAIHLGHVATCAAVRYACILTAA